MTSNTLTASLPISKLNRPTPSSGLMFNHGRCRYMTGLIALICVSQLWFWSSTMSLEPSQVNRGDDTELNRSIGQDHDRLRYLPKDPSSLMILPASTWTCTLEGDNSTNARKSRQCVVNHVCVDDQGLFLLSEDPKLQPSSVATPFPEVNLMSSRPSADYYWKPRSQPIAGMPTTMHYQPETVFVYGLFWPDHFSHFLYDGMLPLYSTMKRFGGKESSWLLRQAEYVGENRADQAVWEMDAVFAKGKELVLNDFEVVSDFQVLPPKGVPICFERAVVGLGSQCPMDFCASNTPTEVYHAYRDQLQDYYWPSVERWNKHLKTRHQGNKINNWRQRKQGRKEETEGSDFSPRNCLQSARYYNFDDDKEGWDKQPNASTHQEPLNRRGKRDPDQLDSEARHRHRPVVAIVERQRTRAVLNLDDVISTIVKSRQFRLKVLNYDLGCGIPETAYLMRDVNILISPHGNALGGSLWMPSPPLQPLPVVISVDSTRYSENWFQWTTTAMGQRFTLHQCGPVVSFLPSSSQTNGQVCPLHRDLDLARNVLRDVGLVLDKSTEDENLMDLTGAEFPIDLYDRHIVLDDDDLDDDDLEGGENDAVKFSQFLSNYWKSLGRYADPDRMIVLLERIKAENEEDFHERTVEKSDENVAIPGRVKDNTNSVSNRTGPKSFLEVCKESRCCGPDCEGIMNRNVVGNLRAFDQDIREGHWGEHLVNEEQDEFESNGQDLRSWSP